MRICIVYDCLFPWTVGGAERWYRNLAERLAAGGHDVTYLTRLQWDPADPPAAARRARAWRCPARTTCTAPTATAASLRRCASGAGCSRISRATAALRRRPHRVVPLLLAAGGRPGAPAPRLRPRRRLARGVVAALLARVPRPRRRCRSATRSSGACVRIPQRAFCFSRLHRDRLLEEGLRSTPRILEGEYAGDLTPPEPNDADPVVVFAGRHIREKRAPAVAAGHRRGPRRGARAARRRLRRRARARPACEEAIACGRRAGRACRRPASSATTCSTPPCARRCAWCCRRSREGYGMVVVEARLEGHAVRRGPWRPDNAAVELVEDGVNGVVADSAQPEELAARDPPRPRRGPAAARVDVRVVRRQRPAPEPRVARCEQVAAGYARWDSARS